MVTERGWHECAVLIASSLYSDPVETPFSLEFPWNGSWPPAAWLPGIYWGAVMGNTVLTCTEAASVAPSTCCCHSVKSVRPHPPWCSSPQTPGAVGWRRVIAEQRWEARGWDLMVRFLTWELRKRLLCLPSLLQGADPTSSVHKCCRGGLAQLSPLCRPRAIPVSTFSAAKLGSE